MKNQKTVSEQLEAMSHKELHQCINAMNSADCCDTHIAIELAISCSQLLSDDQRLELLSLLFMVSLRQGIMSAKALEQRAADLVVGACIKEALLQVTEELKNNPNSIFKSAKGMINDLFSSPFSKINELVAFSEWIKTYPALSEMEKDALYNTCRQCLMLIDMANNGDDSAKKALTAARIQWHVERISQAICTKELEENSDHFLKDPLLNISQDQLKPILECIKTNVSEQGYVDLQACITDIIRSVILKTKSDTGASEQGGWLHSTLQSTVLRSLIQISRTTMLRKPLKFSGDFFRKKSMHVFGYTAQ